MHTQTRPSLFDSNSDGDEDIHRAMAFAKKFFRDVVLTPARHNKLVKDVTPAQHFSIIILVTAPMSFSAILPTDKDPRGSPSMPLNCRRDSAAR